MINIFGRRLFISLVMPTLFLAAGLYAFPNERSNRQDSPEAVRIVKAELADYIFTIKRCLFSGSNIVFDVLIQNTSKDRDVIIYSAPSYSSDDQKTRFIDLEGNEYLVGLIQMGDRSADSKKNEPKIQKTIPMMTSMKLTLVFRDMPPLVRSIPLLEICFFNIDEQRGYKCQLRNIPVDK